MNINHIHFAAGATGEEGVIIGMRRSSEVLIFIDSEKAMESGIKFYRSKNNVILSPGDINGAIKPCYFSKVYSKR